MDCLTCGRHFPLSLKNRYEKHLYLCGKFQEHIQVIDQGLLVCRICDNDYDTQEKIFRHISKAHYSEKPWKKKAKRTIVTFRKNRCRFCKKNIYGVNEGTAENHEKKCPKRRNFDDAQCIFCSRFYSSGQGGLQGHERKCLKFLKYYQFGTDHCRVCKEFVDDYKNHFITIHSSNSVLKLDENDREKVAENSVQDLPIDDSEQFLNHSRNLDEQLDENHEIKNADTDEIDEDYDDPDPDPDETTGDTTEVEDPDSILKDDSDVEIKTNDFYPHLTFDDNENNGYLGEITEVFLCPFCDRAFLDEEFVAHHVRIVHKTTKSLFEMGVKIKSRKV